jgi:hypothetical protein
MSQTQLSSASSYNVDNIIFSDPQVGSIPDSKPAINFKRIFISTKNADGSIGELVIPTCKKLFSFGVGENLNQDTGNVNGYVFPICLYSRNETTKEEKEWVNTFNKIVDKCKEHLLDNKETIEKYDLDESDLKKFNPLYWKKDKGKIIEDVGPTLYAKLIMSKKLNKITSIFYDREGRDVDPMELCGKYLTTSAAIKFESIFIGNKISLQVKLYEAEVNILQTGIKRLLSNTISNEVKYESKSIDGSMKNSSTDLLVDDDSTSIIEDDEVEEIKPVEVKPVEVKPVKKTVIKKKTK